MNNPKFIASVDLSIKDIILEFKKKLSHKDQKKVKKILSFTNKYLDDEGRYIVQNTIYSLLYFNFEIDLIIACILFYPVKINKLTINEIEKISDTNISNIVSNLLKISKLHLRDNNEAEILKKIFVVIAGDTKTILLKSLIKIHTVRYHQLNNITDTKKLAKTLQEVYAPVINILGIWELVSYMENLSLICLKPTEYHRLSNIYSKRYENYSYLLIHIKKIVSNALKKIGIKATIEGRMKQISSIYKKLMNKNKTFNEIYDVFAVRVLTNNINDCYRVLGIIHNIWRPKPGRFKDYIATPKSNGYKSLHTTIFGPEGKTIEFQIRTHRMNDEAEFGLASHWIYKTKNEFKARDLEWIKDILQYQKQNKKRFIDKIELDIFKDKIFVLSKKGKIIDLPKGSTCLDYCYYFKPKKAYLALYCLVNDKKKNINKALKTGDIIDIVYSKTPTITNFWLRYAKSSLAKNKIDQWLKTNKTEILISTGKNLLNKNIKKYTGYTLNTLKRSREPLFIKTINNDIYKQIGTGEISVLECLKTIFKEKELINIRNRSKYTLKNMKNVVALSLEHNKEKKFLNWAIKRINLHSIQILKIYPNILSKTDRTITEFIVKIKKFDDLFNLINELDLSYDVYSTKLK